MPWKISRTFYDDDFPDATVNDKITIFEDRVVGWQLEIAEQMADKVMHSGFAVLSILTSYFEMISKFREGYCREDRSGHYFREGMRWVFPQQHFADNELALMYRELRSGLYHAGITGPRVVLGRDFSPPISCVVANRGMLIQVNPHTLPAALQDHFSGYIRQLRNASEVQLREAFERRFDYQGAPFRKSTQFLGS